jgi:hypothetical protein
MLIIYYSYDTCTVNVEFSGIPTIRPPGNDGKEKIVATGSSSEGSELQRYKGDLNLCTTKDLMSRSTWIADTMPLKM